MSWLISSIAHAQAAPAPGGQPSFWVQMVPFAFMLVVLYLLILRPQAKRAKTHQDFLAKLKRGDTVVTNSGIFGKIEGITEQFVTLEVADGVRIKMLKSQVAGPVNEVKA